jgi:DNA-binding phage protein
MEYRNHGEFMSNKESAAMAEARKLVLAGDTPTEAAGKTGIARNSIYRANWYKAYKANKALK